MESLYLLVTLRPTASPLVAGLGRATSADVVTGLVALEMGVAVVLEELAEDVVGRSRLRQPQLMQKLSS